MYIFVAKLTETSFLTFTVLMENKGTSHQCEKKVKNIAKMFLPLLLIFTFSVSAFAQGMTDNQVIEYVKNATAAGKSEREMISELGRRGVSRAQAERIKARLEEEQGSEDISTTERAGVQERQRRHDSGDKEVEAGELDLIATDLQDPSEVSTQVARRLVYGRNIFNSHNLTFAPSQNMATPENYRLGPGDEVIIDIWGTIQTTIREVISPEGYINVSNIGLIYLNGMTLKEADGYLRQKLDKIYSGIYGDNPTSDIKLTLGQIRSIQINMMGEVAVPGTYSLSSLSNVFHALYRAGGVGRLGSLRNIRLIRGGKNILTIDVYDFIQNGKMEDDVTLEEGDIILVSPYEMMVDISGNVKRPMYYEMKDGETIADLIEFAGGFTGDAYTDNIRMMRQNGREYQVFTIDDTDFGNFKLMDGDAITVGAMLDRFENLVEVKGAVYRPGIYQFGDGINTVRQLVSKAEGLMEEAFTNRAMLHRQREDLTLEVLPVNIKGVMDGTSPDIELRRNDVLYIPSIHDLEDMGSITVLGEVAKPGSFAYADNTTLEDIIIQAGGLRESASTMRVDVSRRIKDSKGMEPASIIGETYTFSLKDGFVIDGEAGFLLQPYDQVFVRRSPAYQPQTNVHIYGEVLFGGTFALTQKGERLSDLVEKAGGLTPYAYIKGARLTRQTNGEERMEIQKLHRSATSKRDTLILEHIGNTYSVGIDLEKALANPGGDADLVLREGDSVLVPEYDGTVHIYGTVLYPNTVSYDKGKNCKYYLDQAGGYAARAKKNKVYVVYVNGQVTHAKKGSSNIIEPGCQIVVPSKPERNWSLQNTLSIATTSASLATMIATIANILE